MGTSAPRRWSAGSVRSAARPAWSLGYILMLGCCWLLFSGSLEQTKINWDVSAPSSGASMAWFYAVGMVFGASAAAILLNDLVKLLIGHATEADLSLVKESEEEA